MSRASHFLRPLVAAPHDRWNLVIVEHGQRLAGSIELAADSRARRRGLLGRASLGAEAALIIAPCNGVHTFGMAFAIDVIYADRDGRVVKIREEMRPGRLSFAPRAFAVIEMAAGGAARAGLSRGDRLVLAREGTLLSC